MRDEAEALEQAVAEFQTELSLDRELFDRLVGLEGQEGQAGHPFVSTSSRGLVVVVTLR